MNEIILSARLIALINSNNVLSCYQLSVHAIDYFGIPVMVNDEGNIVPIYDESGNKVGYVGTTPSIIKLDYCASLKQSLKGNYSPLFCALLSPL